MRSQEGSRIQLRLPSRESLIKTRDARNPKKEGGGARVPKNGNGLVFPVCLSVCGRADEIVRRSGERKTARSVRPNNAPHAWNADAVTPKTHDVTPPSRSINNPRPPAVSGETSASGRKRRRDKGPQDGGMNRTVPRTRVESCAAILRDRSVSSCFPLHDISARRRRGRGKRINGGRERRGGKKCSRHGAFNIL